MSELLEVEAKKVGENGLGEAQQLVVFRIEGESFGVEIIRVNEIIRLQQITPIPNSPAHLLGRVNLRGKMISVFDLRCCLGMALAKATEKSRIMVIETEEERIGVVVDEVTEVLSIISTERQMPPKRSSRNYNDFITDIVKHDERRITLLNLDRVLAA